MTCGPSWAAPRDGDGPDTPLLDHAEVLNDLCVMGGGKAEVHLFTDGACSGNPGPGGWAYILRHVRTGREKRAFGGQRETTNNRMELMAVIEGLEALQRPTRVRVVTDSQYVSKGWTEWLDGWIANDWMRGKGRKKSPVKNADLWRRLLAAAEPHTVSFEYVAGHAGHDENEECDRMAVAAIESVR